jgi:spermidine synthase
MLPRERLRLLILLLFFLSGISGLVYQIVWTRLLVLIFGNTLLANSTVVAAFMAGLAAGSYFFGRFVNERPRRPGLPERFRPFRPANPW